MPSDPPRYFSEQVRGDVPRDQEELSGTFWAGFVSLLESLIEGGSFAEAYPSNCFERPLPVETDRSNLGGVFTSNVPAVSWPLDRQNLPPTLAVLDAVQFFARVVSQPDRLSYHPYAEHQHILAFDRAAGFQSYRSEVNTMLRRSSHPYELTAAGTIERIGPPILRDQLAQDVPASGDADLDRLLSTAIRKFRDADPEVRLEALEKLWDAWERLKTLLPGDKRTSAEALLVAAIAEPQFRGRVELEAHELTKIGNTFRIRHSETDKIPIQNGHDVDYLFHRMFALILRLLRSR